MRFKGASRAAGLLALLVMPAGACSLFTETEPTQRFTAGTHCPGRYWIVASAD